MDKILPISKELAAAWAPGATQHSACESRKNRGVYSSAMGQKLSSWKEQRDEAADKAAYVEDGWKTRVNLETGEIEDRNPFRRNPRPAPESNAM